LESILSSTIACLTSSGLVLGVENSLMILAHPVSLFFFIETLFCFQISKAALFETHCFDEKIHF
jgi:hypothetical protein